MEAHMEKIYTLQLHVKILSQLAFGVHARTLSSLTLDAITCHEMCLFWIAMQAIQMIFGD
jgi:hypothetical protein